MNYSLSYIISFTLCCYLFYGCANPENETLLKQENQLPEGVNILWLVTEDMGHYLSSFGDSTAPTPNLNRLASQGVIYPNLFSPSGVCAPSRAAIATGMYPSSIGANHMRTHSYTEVTGLPAYEAVPPSEIKMISEQLRMQGYYCTNNSKEDYQFEAPVTAWDEKGNYAHWRNRAEGQPFFSIFNFNVTHESGLFEPYGFRRNELRHYESGNRNFKNNQWNDRTSEKETPIHIPKDTDFAIPPYLPDTDSVRRDLWKMYNNIAEMDRQVGAILAQLEQDGLLDNTIIFFFADHGGPLPRQKRLIYDSGLRAPMIIRFPNKQMSGTIDSQLVSFIDFAPTLLSIIGNQPPQYLQGQAFLGKYKSLNKRKYIHAAADRFDGYTDAIRAVRSRRYKYIRNYRPEQPYYLPVTYRERIPSMRELLRLHDQGKLNDHQAQWFREQKDPEELFDCERDPHELINLANTPDRVQTLVELRVEMDRWLLEIGDRPGLAEIELVNQLWSNQKTQPRTENPAIKTIDNQIQISCKTPGASIGYKITERDKNEPTSWQIYKIPFNLSDSSRLKTQAHRIGFLPSESIIFGSE